MGDLEALFEQQYPEASALVISPSMLFSPSAMLSPSQLEGLGGFLAAQLHRVQQARVKQAACEGRGGKNWDKLQVCLLRNTRPTYGVADNCDILTGFNHRRYGRHVRKNAEIFARIDRR